MNSIEEATRENLGLLLWLTAKSEKKVLEDRLGVLVLDELPLSIDTLVASFLRTLIFKGCMAEREEEYRCAQEMESAIHFYSI